MPKMMLADNKKFAPEKLRLPVYVQPKFDGIRAICHEGVALSRTFKPIPNQYVQAFFRMHRHQLEGLDGELVVNSHVASDSFVTTHSGVMSEGGIPDFVWWVFDIWDSTETYNYRHDRLEDMQLLLPLHVTHRVKLAETHHVTSLESLMDFEELFVGLGYEGAIVRDPKGFYKNGRATPNSGGLLKIKRFIDGEVKIVGFIELESNQNEAFKDATGHQKRSSHKAGMVKENTLGAVEVIDSKGREFNVGSGFDVRTRQEIWNNKDKYLNTYIKIKYMEVGGYAVPRHGTFKGFRNPMDMS